MGTSSFTSENVINKEKNVTARINIIEFKTTKAIDDSNAILNRESGCGLNERKFRCAEKTTLELCKIIMKNTYRTISHILQLCYADIFVETRKRWHFRTHQWREKQVVISRRLTKDWQRTRVDGITTSGKIKYAFVDYRLPRTRKISDTFTWLLCI